jgi:hypothetical protein
VGAAENICMFCEVEISKVSTARSGIEHKEPSSSGSGQLAARKNGLGAEFDEQRVTREPECGAGIEFAGR